MAVATGVVSKETSTVSEAPNPLPETLTLKVGEPTVGVSLIWAAAGAKEAPVGAARPTVIARESRGTRNRTRRNVIPSSFFEAVRGPMREGYQRCPPSAIDAGISHLPVGAPLINRAMRLSETELPEWSAGGLVGVVGNQLLPFSTGQVSPCHVAGKLWRRRPEGNRLSAVRA